MAICFRNQIFENPKINQALDSIYNLVEANFGDIGDKISVCGSVAKILDGKFAEHYEPKDIDLVVNDLLIWRFLLAQIRKINAKIFYEKMRFILYFDGFCVEIWMKVQKEIKKGVYKQKIHYNYAN